MTARNMRAALALAFAFAAPIAFAGPGEVRLLSAGALKDAITEAAPAFERECGCKLVAQFAQAGLLKRQIEAGDGFDVAILPVALVEDLAKQGRLAGAPQPVARSGQGLIVRAGAPRPDMSSEETVKSALLKAKSFGYSKEGASADALKRLVDKLGIAAEMQPRLMPVAVAADSVAKGESEMGLVIVSALAPDSGVDVAGALPVSLQTYVNFAAATSAAPGDAKAAGAFVKFLRSPAMAAALKTKPGLEPAP